MSIRVHGKETFKRNNQAFLAQTMHRAQFGLDMVANTVKAEAEANCPVGTPESTGIPGYIGGTLKAGHEITPAIEGKYRFIRYLSNDTYYARFVHDGTYKMRARPWFLNAVEATRGDFVAIMSRM